MAEQAHPFTEGKPKPSTGSCALCGEDTERPTITVCGPCMEMLEQEEWDDSMGMDAQ